MVDRGGNSHQRAMENRLLGVVKEHIAAATQGIIQQTKVMPPYRKAVDGIIAALGFLAEYLALRYGSQWLAWAAAVMLWIAITELLRIVFAKRRLWIIFSSAAVAGLLVVGTLLLVGTETYFEDMPGMSFHAVLKIDSLRTGHRRYVAEFGNSTSGQVAMYVSDDNIFTLLVTTKDKEPYAVQVPLEDMGKLDDYMYLVADVGIARTHSALRLSSNGRELRRLTLQFPIDIGSINVKGGKLGSDLSGSNGANFSLAELLIYSSTLTEVNEDRNKCYISTKYNMNIYRAWWPRIFGAFKPRPIQQ